MALDSTSVRVAPSGHVSIAPFGTALPTTVLSALNAAFVEVGYTDDNGVSMTPNVDTQGIPVWQSAADALTIVTKANLDIKTNLMQVNQTNLSNYFFGSTWSQVAGVATLTLNSSPLATQFSLVVEWTDDQNFINRLVIARVIFTDRDALVLNRSTATAMGVTMHALDNGGNFGTLLSNNPHLTSGT